MEATTLSEEGESCDGSNDDGEDDDEGISSASDLPPLDEDEDGEE